MDDLVNSLVDAIHATATKAVVITTGGGTDIVPTLLRRGGGSATLISALTPYLQAETIDLLGGKPDKMVSEPVGRALAMAAYQRAVKYGEGAPVIGVASTSILQKTPKEDRPNRMHAFYAALQTPAKSVSVVLEYTDASTVFGDDLDAAAIRLIEEDLNMRLMLNLIAEGCGLAERVPLPAGFEARIRRVESVSPLFADAAVSDFMTGKQPMVTVNAALGGHGIGLGVAATEPAKVILSGSFNPAHDGHAAMAAEAKRLTGSDVDFEITIRNADKPPADFISLEKRLCSIAMHGTRKVVLTNAPNFIEKARLLPGRTFAIGYDTALRIVDPRFYGGSETARDLALKELAALGTRFLVFARLHAGAFEDTLEGGAFTPEFCTIASMAPGFRMDVSSTEIRKAAAA